MSASDNGAVTAIPGTRPAERTGRDPVTSRGHQLVGVALVCLAVSGLATLLASVNEPLAIRLVQLALILTAMGGITAAWRHAHRSLSGLAGPLRWIAGEIRAMQQSGRWAPLPAGYANELDIVVSGLNHLTGRVEEQKRRLGEQIIELERVNAELGQLAALKDGVLEAIDRRLRLPVAAIHEGVALIRNGAPGPITDEQRTFMQVVDENAARLARLVDEILDLTLLKSGRRRLERRPEDLAVLLRRRQAHWQATAPSCGIRLVCDPLPPVYMDAAAVQEVMDHLLRNALRHAPSKSDVLIEAHVRGGMVEVSVHDHGPSGAPESQSNGLGLAFCRQVIERHRGSFRADSSGEGRGTALTCSLPPASQMFVFEESCRAAQEEAGYEDGQFGLLLATPAPAGLATSAPGELMRRAEALLRRQTHRGDQFVRLDDLTLVIVAVTDRAGMDAMSARLRGLLRDGRIYVHLAGAVFPSDGTTPGRLLEVARSRSPEPERMGSIAGGPPR